MLEMWDEERWYKFLYSNLTCDERKLFLLEVQELLAAKYLDVSHIIVEDDHEGYSLAQCANDSEPPIYMSRYCWVPLITHSSAAALLFKKEKDKWLGYLSKEESHAE